MTFVWILVMIMLPFGIVWKLYLKYKTKYNAYVLKSDQLNFVKDYLQKKGIDHDSSDDEISSVAREINLIRLDLSLGEWRTLIENQLKRTNV